MKICFFGIYDPTYSRNVSLVDGLRAAGAEVVECNVRVGGIQKYLTLIRRLRALRGQYDVLYCAFPVYVSIILAYLFQRQPIVVDAFFPKYDAAINDRKTHTKYQPITWWFYILDWAMVTLATHVVADTHAHKVYWQRWRAAEAISVLPVGVHTGEFYPVPRPHTEFTFLVQFHGSYIPLQGVDRLVEAAALLRDEPDIAFRFIGAGQTYVETVARIQQIGLVTELLPWLPITELNDRLNEADLILGIFGETNKADRVIPNKVYQGLAVRRPVLTKDTPAIREQFSERELFLCRNEPDAIAASIRAIRDNQMQAKRVAAAGYTAVSERFGQRQLGAQLLRICQDVSTIAP